MSLSSASVMAIKIWTKQGQQDHRSSAKKLSNHQKWLSYKILGGKIVGNVKIYQQTMEIWPTDLNITLSVSEGVSESVMYTIISQEGCYQPRARPFTDSKALKPNYCRQPILCLKVLAVKGNESCLFLDQGNPLHPLYSNQQAAAEGTAFNVFSYDAVWAENRTHHLSDDDNQMLYMLRHIRGIIMSK